MAMENKCSLGGHIVPDIYTYARYYFCIHRFACDAFPSVFCFVSFPQSVSTLPNQASIHLSIHPTYPLGMIVFIYFILFAIHLSLYFHHKLSIRNKKIWETVCGARQHFAGARAHGRGDLFGVCAPYFNYTVRVSVFVFVCVLECLRSAECDPLWLHCVCAGVAVHRARGLVLFCFDVNNIFSLASLSCVNSGATGCLDDGFMEYWVIMDGKLMLLCWFRNLMELS